MGHEKFPLRIGKYQIEAHKPKSPKSPFQFEALIPLSPHYQTHSIFPLSPFLSNNLRFPSATNTAIYDPLRPLHFLQIPSVLAGKIPPTAHTGGAPLCCRFPRRKSRLPRALTPAVPSLSINFVLLLLIMLLPAKCFRVCSISDVVEYFNFLILQKFLII